MTCFSRSVKYSCCFQQPALKTWRLLQCFNASNKSFTPHPPYRHLLPSGGEGKFGFIRLTGTFSPKVEKGNSGSSAFFHLALWKAVDALLLCGKIGKTRSVPAKAGIHCSYLIMLNGYIKIIQFFL